MSILEFIHVITIIGFWSGDTPLGTTLQEETTMAHCHKVWAAAMDFNSVHTTLSPVDPPGIGVLCLPLPWDKNV